MSGQDIAITVYLGVCALIFGYWLWSKATGRKIDNSEAMEKKFPSRPALRAMPYRFRWWHAPVFMVQAMFIGWWVYQAHFDGQNVVVVFFIAVVLCAFLTACLTRLWDWGVQRLRPLRRHGGEPSGDSLRLTGTGRGLSKAPEHRKRIRVRD